MVLFQMWDWHVLLWKPESDKHSSNSPMSHSGNLGLKFWRRADGTSFVSHSSSLIFHSTEIKEDITEFRNVSCYSLYKYFCHNYYSFLTSRRSSGGVFLRNYNFSYSLLWGNVQPWCQCGVYIWAVVAGQTCSLELNFTFPHQKPPPAWICNRPSVGKLDFFLHYDT